MPETFHDGNRRLQDLFDTRRLADHCVAKLVRDSVSAKQKAFIESCDMFFLATVDDQGRPTCSYKGGEPGFVRVPDEHTIAIPNYDGDGKYLSWGNVLKNGQVALLFIDFMKGWRLRVHGTAAVAFDDPLAAEYPVLSSWCVSRRPRCSATAPGTSTSISSSSASIYTPRAGVETPIPDWKKQPDWNAVLPATDPARRNS